ncbi:MAG: hypothetical protein DIZ80_07960 [endosymbiont of Galathealinum brachiosum]|uniref:Uncharacterized protein n=1 Tax=endosymbiont of Galathealinum brachiosum TaxID=2200906 RepID=A0A370DGL4_9GAMM|nr:MAG: hypothetical protein DIZ80_07960 [endosymbiont of Galathealinum brachiosum]
MNTVVTESVGTTDKRHFIAGSIVVSWLTLIVLLGLNGSYSVAVNEVPVTLITSFIITFIVFSVSYISIPAVREYLLGIDMRFLIMLSSWRMIGIGFIMLNMFGHLPTSFSYVAGIGDALTAVAAVFLAFNLMKQEKGVRKSAILRWNTFGLLDFIIAVSLGLLTRTDALLAESNGLNGELMMAFPMVIIPGFLVQILSLTHIIIFLQLRNNHANDAYVKIK